MATGGMSFADAFVMAKRMKEDCNVMQEKEEDGGRYHVIRLFSVEHWEKHYKTVTEIRMVQQIKGRAR